MLAAAVTLAVAAIVLVRLGWGGRRGVAAGGWVMAFAALVLAAVAAGAWGVAVTTLAGIATALAAVAWAAWRSPVRTRRPPRRAPAITVPLRASDLARRAAVFVLVVPVGFAAAQALALGLRLFARAHGAAAADATALAFFAQPVAWAALMTVQMTRANPARMAVAPIAAGALAALLWWAA